MPAMEWQERLKSGTQRDLLVEGLIADSARAYGQPPGAYGQPTGAYVARVRSVDILGEVAILRAVAGMVPAGEQDLKPELNAIQTCVMSHDGAVWRIEVLQNTPAAFHGRPQARAALTEELRTLLRR